MNQKSSFVISEFTNPSGEVALRVSGWLDGKRIRKNFSTRAEAEAERQVLEVQRLQADTGLRTTVTRLTDEQLQQAEAAFTRLKNHPKSLLCYLDFALANYRELPPDKPLAEAVAAYVAAKQRERERDLLSCRQLTSITRELAVLKKRFPKSILTELSTSVLAAYCERNGASLKTCNNRRSILLTFFKFVCQSHWLPANPIDKLPHHRIAHRRGMAVTLTAARAAELMNYVETVERGALVPYYALCLFAGIRPSQRDGEISKLRPEHIRLDTGVILIDSKISKVRMPRRVTIQPNLAAWLRAYPFESLTPSFIDHHRPKISQRFGLTHDVLRHTFISMFVGKFRSMGEAALQAGNSESIIRKHYLDLKTPVEAEQFFSIRPKHRAVPQPVELVAAPQEMPVAV